MTQWFSPGPPSGPISLEIRTARGIRLITAPRRLLHTPVASSSVLQSLLNAAVIAITAMPRRSAEAVQRAYDLWQLFATSFQAEPSPWTLAAFIMLRCAPPLDVPLPDWLRHGVVLPGTAAADVKNLRRFLRVRGQTESLPSDQLALLRACESEPVRMLRRSLGCDQRERQTKKLPFLISHLQRRVSELGGVSRLSAFDLRDLTIIAVGLGAGLRRSEISGPLDSPARSGLRRGDITLHDQFVLVAITSQKGTYSNLAAQLVPVVVPIAHPLLVHLIRRYLAATSFPDSSAPLFPRADDAARPLAPASITNIMRRHWPALAVSAHSLRVGFATELFAAGASIDMILQMGRWSSLSGLLYILPSIRDLESTALLLGSGRVQFSSYSLQRQLAQRALSLRSAPLLTPVLPPLSPQDPRPPNSASSPIVSLPPVSAASPTGSAWSAACRRCSIHLSASEGFLCDVASCHYVLCSACWPAGVDAPLRCPKHRPRGSPDSFRSSSPPSLPPARLDGTHTAPIRLQRLKRFTARQQERTNEATGRRLLGLPTP